MDWMVTGPMDVDAQFLNNQNHILVYSGAPKRSLVWT